MATLTDVHAALQNGVVALNGINQRLKNVTLKHPKRNSWLIYDISNSNALKFIPNGFLTPDQFGALGDGTTDDTAAVQACVNSAMANSLEVSVYFPKTYYITSTITVSSPVNHTLPPFFGLGTGNLGNNASLVTDQDIALLTFDCGPTDMYGACVHDMSFNQRGGPTSNSAGIKIINNGANFFNYYQFTNLGFYNLGHGIYAPSNNGGRDWGLMSGLTVHNCNYGIRITGGGTGNVYAHGNFVVNTAGIVIGESASNTVGDFNIIGFQMGSNGGSPTGIKIDGGVYGANIGVSQCQFDAGINPGWNLIRVNDLEARNINYGGASGPNVIDATCYDLELDERRANGPANAGTGTVNNLSVSAGIGWYLRDISGTLTVTGLAGGYDGRMFNIMNSGVPGVGGNIILQYQNAGSASSNQFSFSTGADVTLAPGKRCELRYLGGHSSTGVINNWVGNVLS